MEKLWKSYGKATRLLLVLLAVSFVTSCNKEFELKVEESTSGIPELQLVGEERATETFNNFIRILNDDPETRSTSIVPIISSVKRTSTSAYGSTQTKSNGFDLPVYELILQNPDSTNGFAVVADASIADEVIAYSPRGSIADTTYNEGLALYFRELAQLSEIISQNTVTKVVTNPGGNSGEYVQPGWDNAFYFKRYETAEIFRWKTPGEPYTYGYYGPIDHLENFTAFVPTEWSQHAPYNNKVPYYVTGTNKRVVVGCYAVAVGQLMAFHKKPTTYNWSLLTSYPMISPGSGANEVSRLLYDIAVAGNTTYSTDAPTGSGSTYTENIISGIDRMGYTANQIYLGSEGGSSLPIREEIKTYKRPVLYSATSPTAGHIWVIDAVISYERWYYYQVSHSGPGWGGTISVTRCRAQCNLMHCNWGWGGDCDGWYYDFNPHHLDFNGNPQNLYFETQKRIFINVKPK